MKWPWSLCLTSLLLFHPQPRLTPHLPLPNLGKSLRSSPTSAPCPCYSCRGNALGMGHIGPQWIIFTGSQCWKKILKLSWFLQMTNWLQIIQIVCVYIYIYNIDTHTHIFHTSVLVSMHIMPPVDQVKFSTKFTASQRARLARLHQPSGVATVLPGGWYSPHLSICCDE